jgi:amino acid adenylation domain-containing protein
MDSRVTHTDHREDLDDLLSRTLLAQLTASGLPRKPASASEIKQALKLRNSYERWLEESLKLLVARGHLECADGRYAAKETIVDTKSAWNEWSVRKRKHQSDPALAVQTALVDKTLQALPGILSGSVRATDIMFPNASMSLVEGIYKNNPIADFFNDTIAEVAVAFIEERLRRDAGARIRILEVGAGTGGTSARVLPRLDCLSEHIAEYCYTDLSRSFLAHGEDAYGAGRPHLRYQIFNVEKPLSGQDIDTGSYDLVIATNVLHATKAIRKTLRNVKAAMRGNGLLLLNELCDKNLPDHLTFGLLDGWWLYEDTALRVPGSPALLPETWQRVLEAEGFRNVLFPAWSARGLGLQVIVAESDGIVRQEKSASSKRAAEKLPKKRKPAPRAAQSPTAATGAHDLASALMTALIDSVCTLLKLNADDIAVDTDLSEYGFDSISFNQLVNQLNQSLKLELAPTVFFDHPTLEAFSGHLLAEHRDQIAASLQPAQPETGAARQEAAAAAEPAVERTTRRLARPASKSVAVTEAAPEPPAAPVAALNGGAAPTPQLQTQPMPLSHGQQQLWFLEQLEDLGPAYHVPLILRLSGALDVEALEQSLMAIVERHHILRARFSAEGGTPVQTIIPAGDFRLTVETLESFPDPDRERAAHVRQQEIVRAPFDLAAGHLFRAVLLHLSDNEHRLVIVMHHIVTDGWSLGVLMQDLGALYTAIAAGRTPTLPDLPLQYTDFVAWQRERVESEAVKGQLAYWREKFRDMPAELALPTDRPRPAQQSFRGGVLPIALTEALTRDLRELARGEGATLYMVLLGAFQLLLSRLSAQTDIAIGTPSAGRSRHEHEHLIGFFSNTLVLRTDLSGDPSFRELLKRVKETALGAYAHQDLPFGQIVQAVNPARDLSRPILFQVMMQLMRDQAEPISMGDLATEILPAETGASQFDMTVTLIDASAQVSGTIEYAADLFDAATVEILVGQFLAVLEGITQTPDHPVRALPLQKQSDRVRAAGGRSDTARELSSDTCVHEMFEAQAAKTPDDVALISGERQLTYAELDRQANQIANHLRDRGVEPDTVVGLFAAQSPEMVAGLLGILKAGGAYLPLDPRYPVERLAYMLADARVATLLTTAELATQLPAQGAHLIRLDADAAKLAQQPDTRPAPPVTAENLAYVIYTSGSTGKPKGVAMPHGALVNLVNWHNAVEADPHSTRILQLTPISFDVSFQEIFTTLASGRCLVLDNGELRLDRTRLIDFIAQGNVDEVFAPQVLLEQIAEEADARDATGLPLKRFYQAGEALRVSPAIARLFGTRSQARLHNQYGPSEAHVVSSFPLPLQPEATAGAAPIGKPIWNTQLYVLDDNMDHVPAGTAGELYIGGACLARGYLNRPGLTAERFVPSPFGDGARLYRTGDRARFLADGNLEFLGRADDQVKIRGFRVELGEIESAMRACANAGQVAVVARGSGSGDKELIAYLVPESPSADIGAIREELRKTLPDYMVPTAFVRLDAFPLTPSGKIDRKSLPDPQPERTQKPSQVAVAARPESAPLEREIAQIWAQVLQRDAVGIDENFFELGGHSLLIMRVHSRLVALLDRSLPVTALFQNPTVRKLAAHLAEAPDEGDGGRLRGAQARAALRKSLMNR